ncbi:transcription antitermination factor NusB [Frischella perrara]|uniref:Transcription antitermination protein NusB n=1 Tax=Frischella perrara TaxID=1267021 RepID=A0A0A7S1F8_FRIPE|nr:transcription antitermination factor NusB [Frischella perrara]AJA45370.1 NusB antitermination factor [Frischella perrara]MCT6875334.1 transcription antitermination factor NusB [Frischella perrara]PWV63020.1 NusB antitermination factor [Frischella perrara]PXY94851.1 transcription antitermination factor NusB [Frischella perrara]
MTTNVNPRRRARECAVQAIYSWQVSKNDLSEIEASFMAEQDMKGVDKKYFRELLHGVISHSSELDTKMESFLNERSLDELGFVEHAILRIAVYELLKREDVPYKVVINEAIDLTKTFGAEDSHKFINGVLDKVAPTIRTR